MTPETAYWIFAAIAGVFGLLFGSFLNVCIARMPEDRSVVFPSSHCPACGAAIRPYDNVPVLAWFWLRGRCRDCASPISGLYPTMEALMGVFAVLLFRRVMPDLADVDRAHLFAYAWYFWLLFALVGLTFIDLRHQIIPDPFSIYSVPVGVGGAALLHWLGYTHGPTWQESAVGAVCGAGVLLLVAGGYWLLRRQEGMGMGDAKLLALIGAYFGAYPGTLYILMLGATAGAITGSVLLLVQRRGLRSPLPFGPFLALGTVIWLFFGDVIWRAIGLG